jgi:hypothetical protein
VRKKSAIKFVLWWNWLHKTRLNSFLPYFPYNPKAKLRLEVLFKKFHPRINRTTIYSTKLCLLNTIKPFLGHENRSLTKSQNNLQGGYLLFLDTKILDKSDTRVIPCQLDKLMSPWVEKFQNWYFSWDLHLILRKSFI